MQRVVFDAPSQIAAAAKKAKAEERKRNREASKVAKPTRKRDRTPRINISFTPFEGVLIEYMGHLLETQHRQSVVLLALRFFAPRLRGYSAESFDAFANAYIAGNDVSEADAASIRAEFAKYAQIVPPNAA